MEESKIRRCLDTFIEFVGGDKAKDKDVKSDQLNKLCTSLDSLDAEYKSGYRTRLNGTVVCNMITTSISRARTFILANADEIAKHDMEFAILISDDMADKRVERGSVVLLAECGDNRLRILFKEHGMDFVFSKKGSLVNTENSIETVSGYTDAAYNEVSLLFGQSVNRFQQPSNVRRIGIGVK